MNIHTIKYNEQHNSLSFSKVVEGKTIIYYNFEGITQEYCNQHLFKYSTLPIQKSQKNIFRNVFKYISSIFSINFIEVKNSNKTELYIGQVLDKISDTNKIECKTLSNSTIYRASISINGLDINDAKIKYYPNYCFAKILKSIINLLIYSSNSISIVDSITRGLIDEEYNTKFSDLDIKVISSRYHLKKMYKETLSYNNHNTKPVEVDIISEENLELLKTGKGSAIRRLVEDGFNVNRRYKRETKEELIYPLGEAVVFENIEAVKILIAANAKVNLVRGCYSLLVDSCHKSNKEMSLKLVKILLEAGADPNFYNYNEFYQVPLIESAKNNNLEVCKLLLQYNADLNTRNNEGNTAIYEASLNEAVIITELLYDKGAEIDLASALILGIKDKVVVELKGCSLIEKHRLLSSLLLKSIEKENISLAKAIIEFGVVIEDHVFMESISRGNKKIVELLISNGANIDSKDKNQHTALHIAILKDYLNLVNLLIHYGADITIKDKYGNNYFHLIMSMKSSSNVTNYCRIFANTGLDVNEENEEGLTMLHLAIENKANPVVVDLFKEYGGTLNPSLIEYHYNYIEYAIDSENYSIIPNLLVNGCSINLISALMLSMPKEAIRILNENKKVELEVDLLGNTVLHHAVKQGYIDVVMLLNKRGINVNALNNYYKTPLDILEDKNSKNSDQNQDLISYLKSYGAVDGKTKLLMDEKQESENFTINIIDIRTRRVVFNIYPFF